VSRSLVSVVSIATALLNLARYFSLLYSVQTGSESQAASYFFPGDKAVWAWSRTATSTYSRG